MKKLYPFFIAFLLPLIACTQDLVVKGLVTVQPNGLLHVEGDVDIQSPSGVLDVQASGSQHGLVKVNIPEAESPGLWTCNGTTTGGGDVQFVGVNVNSTAREVDYTVSGSNVSFPNLILDFGGTPVGGVQPGMMTLSNNATITQTLTLTKGKIVTGSNEISMADSAANAITGNFGSQKSRYIEGTLRRAIKTVPNTSTYYRFPIGSASAGYNPASIDLRSNIAEALVPTGVTSIVGKFKDMTNIGTVGLQYTTSGDCYFTTAQQYLEFYWMVHNYGYWDFKPNDTTKATGWNYDFYCFPNKSYLDSGNPGLTHLKIFKAPSTTALPSSTFNWNPYFFQSGSPCNGVNVAGGNYYWHPKAPGSYSLSDSIAAWDLNSFSRFGLGGGTGAGLPIELLYLQAYPVNNEYIQVAWATETEINNDYFDVLRSTDGVNFTWIGSVDGAGNSSQRLTYTFKDENVDPNVLYYYRLKQVDFDETSELTYIVTAMITGASTFTISEFIPNPSENDSRIEVVSSKEKDLNITVYNTLGQIVMNGDHSVVAGINTIDFDFNRLADGTYYAIIKADNEFYNRKLILTK